MKTDVFVTYKVCKMRDKDNAVPITVEQYEDLIGLLAYFDEVFDIKVEVTTVTGENNPGEMDVNITHTVVVY